MTMTDFFEVDEKQKTVKILNLDDFSVEDLQNYISELQTEILRVQDEIKKKENLKLNAEKLFKYKNLQMKRPIKKIDIIWIMGPPGSGKSRIVHELEDDLYQPITAKWWDGYNGQKAILLDDFRSNWCDYNYFLRLTDMYPLTVEVKGGSYPAMWDKVYITCPHSPEKTFRYLESIENNKQVLRRITAQFDLSTMSWDIVLSQLRDDKTEQKCHK